MGISKNLDFFYLILLRLTKKKFYKNDYKILL